MKQVAKTWSEFFKQIENKEYSFSLHKFLDEEYRDYKCYPPRELLFNAFKLTPLNKVKVVIIGQDPYHEDGQAMGLSFSVPKGIDIPPSLINIYKEIRSEYNVTFPIDSGDLTYLAKQGVLLLNTILSVREHEPMSHNIPQYKEFLKDVLDVIDKQRQPIVYMLWGNPAKRVGEFLHNPSHLILEASHPSPLSANRGGWFNTGVFKKCNEYLVKNKVSPIEWYKR